MFKWKTTRSSGCDIETSKGANQQLGSPPSGICLSLSNRRIRLGHDSSAMMRDRHVARSLVKVAMERLRGSLKIFWERPKKTSRIIELKKANYKKDPIRSPVFLLPAWKCDIHPQMVHGRSAWRFGRRLASTGPDESEPGSGWSVSERHGTGFWIPRRTGNPRSAEQSADVDREVNPTRRDTQSEV